MARRSFSCPHCEADVPRAALACPACGSDATTGWSDDAEAWAGDLPAGYDGDDEFDEQAFLVEEGLIDGPPTARQRERRRQAAVALLLAALVVVWILLG